MVRSMKEALIKEDAAIRMNGITYDTPLKERAEILRGFSEGFIDVVFAMKILDEGVDVPQAEIGIFASSAANPRQFIQRRGRLLRKHPDKEFAKIYDMVVVPNYSSPSYDDELKKTERALIKSELTRVAYFLASP